MVNKKEINQRLKMIKQRIRDSWKAPSKKNLIKWIDEAFEDLK